MLGDIASIATLILFVIYFIGRIITIFRMRTIFYDEVTIEDLYFDKAKYDIVETFDLDENACNSFILSSKNGLYSISIYKLYRDDELNIVKKTKVGGYKFLNIGQSLEIRSNIPELLPNYQIECYTPDYKKVTIELWENLKNGVVSESVYQKHTFKSVLYYLFK